MEAICEYCGKQFTNKTIKRHIETKHKREEKKFNCDWCNKTFGRKDNLQVHIKNVHKNKNNKRKNNSENADENTASTKNIKGNNSFIEIKYCEECSMEVDKKYWNYHIRTNTHKAKATLPYEGNIKIIRQGFQGRIATFVLENKNEDIILPEQYFETIKDDLIIFLKKELLKLKMFKFNIELFAEYVKPHKLENDEVENIFSVKSFNSKMEIIQAEHEIETVLDNMIEKILNETEEFQEKDSGWSLSKLLHLEININEYKPLQGSQYIKLPKQIEEKKACINIKNRDVYCFKWCLISALQNRAIRNPQRCENYAIDNINAQTIILNNAKVAQLEFGNLEFPLHHNDIKDFERMNPEISITVYGYEKGFKNSIKIIGPYYHTKEVKNHHIEMLLITKNEISHYVWVKNLSRLVQNQLSKHGHRNYFCRTCLCSFTSQQNLQIHKKECANIITKLPSPENKFLKFKNWHKKMRVPFVVYADSESLLQPVSTCEPNPKISSTTNIKKHFPIAFSYYIKCSFDSNLNIYKDFTGMFYKIYK